MKKRLIAMMLAALLVAALGAPAMAEDSIDQAMADITLLVKQKLGIGNEYTDFSGDYEQYLRDEWYLWWSGDDGSSVSVSCDADGTILEYSRYVNSGDSYTYYNFDPHFSALSEEEARAAAEDFSVRALGEGEQAVFTSCVLGKTARQNVYLSGMVELNGYPSPITLSVSVNADGTVTEWSRSDSWQPYAGGVPAAEGTVSQSEASETLAATLDAELYWQDTGDGTARLVWVPCGEEQALDANTGELFVPTAVGGGSQLYAAEADMTVAEEAAGVAMLTETELASIADYEDVQDVQTLDAQLRARELLGLDGEFELVSVSYDRNRDDGIVTATLYYRMPMREGRLFGYSVEQYRQWSEWEELFVEKTLTVDAADGTILSVNTLYPLYEREAEEASGEALRAVAEQFVTAESEHAADAAVCTLSRYAGMEEDGEFVFARKVDGYFYPADSIRVGVNPAEGTIDSYSVDWDEEPVFEQAKELLTKQEALELLAEARELTEGYVQRGTESGGTGELAQRYLDWGYEEMPELVFAWYYGREIAAIDAETGAIQTADEQTEYVYDDTEGVFGEEAIERLAEAGIGLAGGHFGPGEALDERTAVLLALSAAGYDGSEWTDEELGDRAQRYGFVDTWEPDKALTVSEGAILLLRAGKYAPAAELESLWTGVKSRVGVQAEAVGYETIAAALGMFAETDPSAAATRADFAIMLCALMSA